MNDLLPWVQWGVVASFAALTFVAVARLPRTGRAGRWVAAAFGVLTIALLTGRLETDLDISLPDWLDGIELLLLLSFPYLLLRFTASFRELPRWMEILAAAAVVGVLTSTVLLLPDLDLDSWLIPAVLVYWVLVSSVTVVRLWRAGHQQPTVARRRMRLMSAATAILAVALILAVAPLADDPAMLTVQLVALASAMIFALGFAPPRAVRLQWRKVEDEHLQQGTMSVLRATSEQEVAERLLAPTAAIVGAAAAVLLDADHQALAEVGDVPEELDHGRIPSDRVDSHGSRQVIPLGDGRGELVVWTTPYAPFFGREEVELLHTMAAVATLAFERCELLEAERFQREALESARGEAEEARREAERANLAKSDFLSRMSHELRTPLNAILGFGQLLETTELDEEQDEGITQMLKAGRHLLALIDDVLDLSRIDAGTLAISLEPVHVPELVEDAVSLIRPRAQERAISLSVEAGSCDLYVLTDRQRCRQALLNLLSNAVKYNYDGGEVEVLCRRPSPGIVQVAVRDSGPGIDPERQHRLFEPFDRLGAEASPIEGTGLGLALTKQLVEHLGGRIGVESTPQQGATFWIDLPVTEPVASTSAATPREQEGRPYDQTLLLVEDNLANLRVVEAMVRRRGGTSVIPAMQGRLAVELATQHLPDVIVLDLHLPDLPGRDVLNRLKADPRTRHIPVVIASAEARPSYIQQLRDDGAYEYLTKPLDLTHFLEVIDAAIEGKARPELPDAPEISAEKS